MRHLLSLLTLLLLALPGLSQNASTAARITVSTAEKGPFTPGQTVTLQIQVEPKKGWHVYSALPSEDVAYMPATLNYDPESRGFAADTLLSEAGRMVTQKDEIMGGTVRYYEQPVTYSQRITLRESEVVIQGSFDFMACDEMKCLPLSESFRLELKVEE